jgi:hypothetical protein
MLCALLIASQAVLATEPNFPASAPSTAETAQFTRLDHAIRFDGRVDDPAWDLATPLTRFYEVYPGDIAIPRVKTEARFLYDDKNIYVRVRAWDTNAKSIRAPFVSRDAVLDDQDYIDLLIDPSGGRHNALVFRTNARGVETDAQFSEETQYRDYTVDLNYDVQTSIDAQGWTAEFRIPLSTLRYRRGAPKSWSFVIFRNWPRGATVSMASAPIPRRANCTLCMAGTMSGLAVTTAAAPVTVAPYVTYTRAGNGDGNEASDSNAGRVGFDAKWQPRPDMAIDLTVKPDFSQVEADDLQLTTNTRFALQLIEKRPFFLEGSDLLNNQNQITSIYTRSITDPQDGLRITRRGETSEYAALVVQDAGGGTVIEPDPSPLKAPRRTSNPLSF